MTLAGVAGGGTNPREQLGADKGAPSWKTSLPARLHIVAWPDPVIDRLGFPPQSPYSEFCRLPRLGPSATLAYRCLAATLAHRPDGFDIDVAELAHSLGLGRGTGAQSPASRTLRRLVGFDLAVFADERTYALRRRIPPLSRSQMRHLSADLQRTHHAMLERHQAEIGSVRAS